MAEDDSVLNSLNITIKEEPLDDVDVTLDDLDDITIKDELEYDFFTTDPLLKEADQVDEVVSDVNDSYGLSSSPITNESISNNICNKTSPVTRKIMINGKETTCVLVKSPLTKSTLVNETEQTQANSSHTSSTNALKVQCPRCKNTLAMDQFRQHIDLCPPKYSRKSTSVGRDESRGRTNGSVSAITNVSKESGSQQIGKEENRNNEMNRSRANVENTVGIRTFVVEAQENSISDVDETRRTRSQSCSRPIENGQISDDVRMLRSRSRSIQLTVQSSELFNDETHENNEDESPSEIEHADQMAYYKKFVELRKKHANSKVGVSPKIAVHRSEVSEGNFQEEDKKTKEIEAPSLLKDNTFSCSTCSFTTDKERTLREHERAHKRTSNPIFRCIYCNQKYTRYALYLHVQSVHPGHRFHVPEKEEKRIDPKEPVKTETFKCPKCTFVADSLLSLEMHLKTRYCNDKLNKSACRVFSCPKCSYTADRIRRLKNHLSAHKNNPKLLRCCFCSFTSTVTAVKCHEQKCSLRFQYKCKLCSYRCQYKSKMDTHRGSHRKNVPILPCPNNCNFKSTPAALKAHVQKSKCDVPLAQSSAKNAVSAVDNRIKANMFKCSKCPFVTNLRLKLNLHIKKRHFQADRNSNSLKCSRCSVITNNKANLRSHMRCHRRNVKNLKCGNCDYMAPLNALARHFVNFGHAPGNPDLPTTVSAVTTVKTENNSKNTKLEFRCPHCPFSANMRIKLRLHLRHHNKEPQNRHKCPYCSVVTTSLSAHIQHTRSHERHSTKTCNCGFKATPVFFSLHKLECGEGEVNGTIHGVDKKTKVKEITKKSSVVRSKSVPEETHVIEQNKKNLRPDSQEVPTSELPLLHCENCQFSTDIPSEMEIHSKKLHLKIFHCKFCSVVVTHVGNFRQHMRAHKRKDPVRKCPYCSFKSIPNCLYKHLKECERQPDHQSKTPTEPEKLFRCETRSFTSKHEENFQTHCLTHEQKQTRTTRRSLPGHNISVHDTEAKVLPEVKGGFTTSEKGNSPDGEKKTLVSESSEEHANNSKTVKNLRKLRLLNCKLCSATGLAACNFKRHMKAHNDGRPMIQCKLCSFKSYSKCFRRHVAQSGHYVSKYWIAKRNKKLEPLTSDETIDEKPNSRTLGNKDLVIRLPKSFNFRCSLCPFVTNLRIKLNIHKKKQHSRTNVNKNNKAVQVDPVSESSTADSIAFKNKKRKREPKKCAYNCNICSYKTSLETAFKKHVDEHKTFFQCQFCGVKGLSDTFRGHGKSCAKVGVGKLARRAYLKKVLLNCDKCSFTTYFPADLKDHEDNGHKEEKVTKTIGEIKNFRCEYCSFTSYWQYLIDRHIQSHTILKLPIEQCSKCDFRSTPAALTAHTNKCVKGSPGSPNRKIKT